MEIIRGKESIGPDLTGAYVTIGNFDGIHLGHRDLFATLIAEARSKTSRAAVITFDPHPKMLLHPERRPFYLITTLEEKIRLLAECGLDAAVIVDFNLEYAKTTAEDFINDFLWGKLRIKKILIGHDYTFGNRKRGNEALLTDYGGKLGFQVGVIEAFTQNGRIVSSTKIREAILRGDLNSAADFLGRRYNLAGLVIPGSRRGRDLGFPTANIRPEKELIPPEGVYAVYVDLKGKRRDGVLNIGTNPTFAGVDLSLEVFLLDFAGDIYGERLNIHFVERIRPEIKFPEVSSLLEQIKRDIARSREILGSSHGD